MFSKTKIRSAKKKKRTTTKRREKGKYIYVRTYVGYYYYYEVRTYVEERSTQKGEKKTKSTNKNDASAFFLNYKCT